MSITKFRFSSAFPKKHSIYDLHKAVVQPTLYNISGKTSPWYEMWDTARLFGKWTDASDRKYLTMSISPPPDANPTIEQCQKLMDAVHERFFKDYQGIGCIHYAKPGTEDALKKNPKMHIHLDHSTVNIRTGKILHIQRGGFRKIRRFVEDWSAQAFGEKWRTIPGTRKKAYSPDGMRSYPQDPEKSWLFQLMTTVTMVSRKQFSSFKDFRMALEKAGVYVFLRKLDGTPRQEPGFGFIWDKDGRFHVARGPRLGSEFSMAALKERYPRFVPEKAAPDPIPPAKSPRTMQGRARTNPAGTKADEMTIPFIEADGLKEQIKREEKFDIGCRRCPDAVAVAAGWCLICTREKAKELRSDRTSGGDYASR